MRSVWMLRADRSRVLHAPSSVQGRRTAERGGARLRFEVERLQHRASGRASLVCGSAGTSRGPAGTRHPHRSQGAASRRHEALLGCSESPVTLRELPQREDSHEGWRLRQPATWAGGAKSLGQMPAYDRAAQFFMRLQNSLFLIFLISAAGPASLGRRLTPASHQAPVPRGGRDRDGAAA
jgi:hypothetical protein